MKWLLILMAVFALTASAADISGTWKGTAETPNGTIERTFVFKVDGDKLTGETTSQMMGKSTITDGKIDGANFQGNEMTLNYKGKSAVTPSSSRFRFPTAIRRWNTSLR